MEQILKENCSFKAQRVPFFTVNEWIWWASTLFKAFDILYYYPFGIININRYVI